MESSPTTNIEQPSVPPQQPITSPEPLPPSEEPGFLASIGRPLTLLLLVVGLLGSVLWSLAIVEAYRTHSSPLYTILTAGLGKTPSSLSQYVSPERFFQPITYPSPTPTPFLPTLISKVTLNPTPTPTLLPTTNYSLQPTPTPTPIPTTIPMVIHNIDVVEGNAYTMLPGSCTNPLTYRISAMDDRFGISKTDFENDIKQAADVWDVPLHKTLFAEDPNGTIQINLVYDDRQPLVVKMNGLEAKLTADSANITSEKQQFDTQKAIYDAKLSAYNDAVANRSQSFDQIQAMFNDLTALQQILKGLVATINTNVASYNAEVATYNATRDQLAALFAKTPYAGLYSVGSRTISIYIDQTQNEFIHTIAHELGHAIGLGHNNNPVAIMYPDATPSISLSTEDTTSIKARCSL